jgi:hypothetical protein
MSRFGREVLEGIAAFQGVSNAMKGDPRGDYYRYLLSQKMKTMQGEQAAFQKGAGPNVQMPSIDSGGGGGIGSLASAGTNFDETYAEGGVVRRYSNGGAVEGNMDPYDAAIDAALSDIPIDPPMDYADQRARNQIHGAVGYPEEVNPSAVAKELNARGQRDREDAQRASRPAAQPAAHLFGQPSTGNPAGDPLAVAVNNASDGQYLPPSPTHELNDYGRRAQGNQAEFESALDSGSSPDPSRQLAARGSDDRGRMARGMAELQRNIPAGEDQLVQNRDEADELSGVLRTRPTSLLQKNDDLVRRARDGSGERDPGETGGTPDVKSKKSSRFDRWLGDAEAAHDRMTSRHRKQHGLRRERAELEPGLFEETTPEERADIEKKVAPINAKLAELDANRGAPAIDTGTAAPPPSAAPRPTPMGTDAAYTSLGAPGVDPNAVLNPRLPLPASGARTPSSPPGQNLPTGPNGPITPASPPGGMGAGAPLAPPPGAMRPSTPPAAGPSDQSLPGEDGFAAAKRRGIVDENGRVLPMRAGGPRAIDTGNPAGNPGMNAHGGTGLNPQGSAQGMSTNSAAADYNASKDLQGAVMGAVQAGQGMSPQQLAAGQGAVSPQTADKIIKKFGANGTLTHGEALMAGLVEVYKYRLERGDIKGASTLAFGILQRANLEAAMRGREAVQMLQSGNLVGGAKKFAEGHDYLPDGVSFKVAPDGSSVIATDINGKTQQLPLDGRWILAASQGMANGSLLWNSLNQAAQLVRGQPKQGDPEKIALEKDLLRARIDKLKRSGTGGGGAQPNVMAEFYAALHPDRAPPAAAPVVVVNNDGGE